MDLQSMGALQALEQLKKVKQREVYCPIGKTRAITTPLMTIDDLSLRTSIMSPDLYDMELTSLLFKHTIFPDTGDKIGLNQFIDNLSYIDRQVLLWGLFASTYNTLGKNDIECPFCKNKWQNEILADELIQEDSITVWDLEVPFQEYVHIISYEVNLPGVYKLEFHTSIPTIKQHLDTLRLVPAEKLRENYQKFGTILSKIEEMVSSTRTLVMYKEENDPQPTKWTSSMDMHMIVSEFLTMDITAKILEEYNQFFNKYVPVFKKAYTCPACENKFNYLVDPEVALFRQFLRDQ